ncbi:MAG: histidinol-phosphate transaminase [Dehalococcoidia bacterium]|nr:histidinol-phosphate transaminase [Dehalococcoidia bacterium]
MAATSRARRTTKKPQDLLAQGVAAGNSEALVRRDLRDLAPYIPIDPPEVLSQETGLPPGRIIKLDGNENPYGPSPKARAALASLDSAHLYPDPEQRELRRALAGHLGVAAEHIVAGSGSDDLLDLLARLTLEPGEGVINCEPTFGMYRFVAELQGAQVTEVPRQADYEVDVEAVARAVNGRTKLLFLASPNNPTGNLLSQEQLKMLLGLGVLVVVDEAYVEFSGTPGFASLVPSQPNLAVLRTFSKWAGLAGLRVGYGIFSPAIAARLMQIKQPYNVNVAAQAAAIASLNDTQHLLRNVERLVRERERLYRGLGRLPFLEVLPSRANFVLCRLLRGRADQVYRRLRGRGIFVRYFDTPLLRQHLRISAGTRRQTDAVVAALEEIGREL